LKEPYGSTIMRQQFEEAYQEAEPSTWVG